MADDPRSLSAKYKISTPASLTANDTVMIIEDQTDLRLIIAHQLQKLNLGQTRQATNGYEAIDMIRTQKLQISAFVCDMEMPVMGGLDMLSELTEASDLDRAPFCLTMDNVSKEKLMLAVENGVDEILVKPFTLGDIGPKIRSAFTKFHNPSNPEKVYELAKVQLREGKLDLAEKIYRDLANAAPKAARPVVGMARIEIKRQAPEKALLLLEEAELKNKNYVHLFTQRALIYAAQDQWDKAIACFKQAIALSPLNPLRYKDASDLLFKVKRYDEAAELLESAIKNDLNFPDLYHYLSQAKFAKRDYKAAQKYIRQALSGSPDNVNYLNQLGICLKETEQPDEALKVYNQVLKLDPANNDGLYNKAILQSFRGDQDDAIKLLERILRKTPDFALAKTKLEEFQKQIADKKKTPGAA